MFLWILFTLDSCFTFSINQTQVAMDFFATLVNKYVQTEATFANKVSMSHSRSFAVIRDAVGVCIRE